MTVSMVLLCVAATALVALSTSAVVAALLRVGGRRLERLAAAAQARVLFAAAVAPLVVSATVMVAALAPSIGWIVDHCAPIADLHGHPHICTAHHIDAAPALSIVLVAGLLLARVLWQAGRLVVQGARSARALRAWSSMASVQVIDASARVAVLPMGEPRAFVIGVFRPSLFVTRGLCDAVHRRHLRAVLAHEHAHLRRRDPLRRAVATVALAFHLPVVARWLETRLARANEMSADAAAAAELRDPGAVASALVALARAGTKPRLSALAFGESSIETRVATLLDLSARREAPSLRALVLGFATFTLAVAMSADGVHHGVESLLGIIGG